MNTDNPTLAEQTQVLVSEDLDQLAHRNQFFWALLSLIGIILLVGSFGSSAIAQSRGAEDPENPPSKSCMSPEDGDWYYGGVNNEVFRRSSTGDFDLFNHCREAVVVAYCFVKRPGDGDGPECQKQEYWVGLSSEFGNNCYDSEGQLPDKNLAGLIGNNKRWIKGIRNGSMCGANLMAVARSSAVGMYAVPPGGYLKHYCSFDKTKHIFYAGCLLKNLLSGRCWPDPVAYWRKLGSPQTFQAASTVLTK
jgi:hypothetical protein